MYAVKAKAIFALKLLVDVSVNIVDAINYRQYGLVIMITQLIVYIWIHFSGAKKEENKK